MMAALPSSSVAIRCWRTRPPNGFRDAVHIMGMNHRSLLYLEVSGRISL
jgi:hypothetical protein